MLPLQFRDTRHLVFVASFTVAHCAEVTPAEARAIAKEAYIWGYALVDDHCVQYAYFIDKANPAFKGTWNTIGHNTRLYTPADTTIQTINSDTLYSLSEWLSAISQS